jgi:hypothetical protein
MKTWTLDEYIGLVAANMMECIQRGNIEGAVQYARQLHRLGCRALKEGKNATLSGSH